MPKHLLHLSHSLSYCSEQLAKAIKQKNKEEISYWSNIHRVITYACRDIGKINYERIKNVN